MLAFALSACYGHGVDIAVQDESVRGRLELIDRTNPPEVIPIECAAGTYTNCAQRTGGFRVCTADSGYRSSLSVLRNDVDCRLTMSGLLAGDDFAATPPLTIGGSYAGWASLFTGSFGAGEAAAAAFYANAKLSPVDFNADFSVFVLFASNLDHVSPSAASGISSAYADDPQVPAPDYTLDFTGYEVKADAHRVVQSATGSVALVPGAHPGESYVTDSDQELGATFAHIESAYTAGTSAPLGSTVTAFRLVGETLPTRRNLIILHAENGVRSYQVLRITFHPPL